MTEDRKNIEHIENFLLGKLSEEAHEAMVKSIQTNENIRHDVMLQKIVMDQLAAYGTKDTQLELNRIHKKYFGKENNRKFIWYFFGIAGIVLMSFIGLRFFSKEKENIILPKTVITTKKITPKISSVQKIIEPIKKDPATIKKKVSELNKDVALPEYAKDMYDRGAASDLNRLSHFTKGEIFFSKTAEINSFIHKVLTQHLTDGSEVVILMDKTQSMKDDIHEVRKNIENIMEKLNEKKHIRICLSAFGDANYNSNKEWFSSSGFSHNKDSLSRFLNEVSLVQGVDTPESLYDALCFQLDEFPFIAKGNRLIILMTDAAAQNGEFTVNNEAFTIEKCRNTQVQIFSIVLQPEKGR